MGEKKLLFPHNITVAVAACLLALTIPACAVDPGAQPTIHNHEAPGNLESKYDLDCIAASQVKNQYTPTDLYQAMAKCITDGKYQDGAFLFALAGVYGRFDILRVEDSTAHQAITVALMQALGPLDQDKRTAFQEGIKTAFLPENLAAMCKKVERIGPPGYFPRYMIQHGMNAFYNNDGGDGLVKDFDAKAAWQQSLTSYLHCPER